MSADAAAYRVKTSMGAAKEQNVCNFLNITHLYDFLSKNLFILKSIYNSGCVSTVVYIFMCSKSTGICIMIKCYDTHILKPHTCNVEAK